MLNLQNVKRDISTIYFSTKETIERYNILNEILDLVDSLSKKTVEQIESGYFSMGQKEQVLFKIQVILAECASVHINSVLAVVHEDSKISHVCGELSLDSLNYVEFIMAVEEEFDVYISDSDAQSFKYINDIIEIIMNK